MNFKAAALTLIVFAMISESAFAKSICEASFETSASTTALVVVDAANSSENPNSLHGRIKSVRSRLSDEDVAAIYQGLVGHPQMLFGRFGDMLAGVRKLGLDGEPVRTAFEDEALFDLKKEIATPGQFAQDRADKLRIEIGDRLFNYLAYFSRRKSYSGERVEDLFGRPIVVAKEYERRYSGPMILKDIHLISIQSFPRNESSEVFKRFFDWLMLSPDRVEFGKLLIAEVAPLYMRAMLQETGNEHRFRDPISLTQIEIALQKMKQSPAKQILRRVLVFGGHTKYLNALLKEKKRVIELIGLQKRIKPKLQSGTQLHLAAATPKSVLGLEDIAFEPKATQLHMKLALFNLNHSTSTVSYATSMDEYREIERSLTEATLKASGELTSQEEKLIEIAETTRVFRAKLEKHISLVGLRNLDVERVGQALMARDRLMDTVETDLRSILNETDEILNHYRKLERLVSLESGNEKIKRKIIALSSQFAEKRQQIESLINQTREHISSSDLMLLTGSVPN